MYKPIIKPPETDNLPQFFDVELDVKKKSASLVPAHDVKYPNTDMFDIDVLAKNGISPELVTTPFITSDVEGFDSNLDIINQKIDYNELV